MPLFETRSHNMQGNFIANLRRSYLTNAMFSSSNNKIEGRLKKRLFLRKIDGQEVVGDQSRARSTKAAAQVAARLDKGRL